jgi:hypothetical protein
MGFKAWAVRTKRGQILTDRVRSTWGAARRTITSYEFKAGMRVTPVIIVAMAHSALCKGKGDDHSTGIRTTGAEAESAPSHSRESVRGPGDLVASEDAGRVG